MKRPPTITGNLRPVWILLCLLPFHALAGAWPQGGSFDGYHQQADRLDIGLPQVNNAGGATNITTTSAWLNGTLLVTSGAPAQVHVYWGTVNGGTTRSSWHRWTNFGVRTEGAYLTTNVSVQTYATYYYRFHVTNSAGEAGWASSAASFVVPGPPLLGSGFGAAPVSFNSAGLNGTFTAGVSAAISVYWGTDTNAWSGTNSLGTRSEGPFRVTLSGPNPATVYYYQGKGINAYGTGWTPTVCFTTRTDSASFAGDSFDGYSQFTGTLTIQAQKGTVFLIL